MKSFATKAPDLVQVKGGFRGRFRCGPGSRPYAVLRVAKKEQAEVRAARMQGVLAALVEAGLYGSALTFLQDMAAAPTERALAGVERAARALIAEDPAPEQSPAFRTFRQVALAFIDGSLREEYPDCGARALRTPLRPRTVETLTTHLHRVDATLGALPVGAVTLEQCDKVKKHLAAAGLAHGSRRNTQLFVRTVLRLAQKPLKLIASLPIDDDWVIPKAPRTRAFQYLHPTEEAQLMRCKKVPILYRLLWAFFCRNGGRKEETLALTWGDITIATGKCNLDDTKTKYPRWWHMDPDVSRALAALKPPGASAGDRVFAGIHGNHLEKKLRKHIGLAKITRPELMKNTGSRRWLTVHDLRATFCTVAMATGWTEFDIMCRSGHVTTQELLKYRRDVAELQKMAMTWFEPLDELLGVEPREVAQVAPKVAHGHKFTVINGGKPRPQGTKRRFSSALPQPKKPVKADRAPLKSGHGPPLEGGVAQSHGPPTLDLALAIANATAAGKWQLAERLTVQLEGLIAAGLPRR
jgi:integrase